MDAIPGGEIASSEGEYPKFGHLVEEKFIVENVPPHFSTVPAPLIHCSAALGPSELLAKPLAIDTIEG